jgi:outer membrane protein assembly factor BamE (lipoprotein component of BamABCDE complex)
MRTFIKYIFIATVIVFLSSCHGIKFDSEKWKNWEISEENATMRWDMRKDLVKQHGLIGLTKEEVINLLGEPSSTHKTENTVRYPLGYAIFGIDTGVLILTLKDDIVINYEFWHG